MTGLSFVQTQASIDGQKQQLALMWKRVEEMKSSLASNGRQLGPERDDPIASGKMFIVLAQYTQWS